MKKTRQNRSKYNFGEISKGDILEIDPLDVHNMKTSLLAFNKYHNKKIVMELVRREINENNMLEFKAVKV